MKKSIRDLLLLLLPVWICTTVALCLIIAGFFVPPIGIIDGSVIQAVGEIIGIIAILQVPYCISKMDNIRFKHNNTEVNMSRDDENAPA